MRLMPVSSSDTVVSMPPILIFVLEQVFCIGPIVIVDVAIVRNNDAVGIAKNTEDP